MNSNISGYFDRRVLVACALLAMLLGVVALWSHWHADQKPEVRGDLLLMSSVPLRWGEATMADVAKGDTKPAGLFERLSSRHDIQLIDDFEKLGAPGAAPLLMVQPRALSPSELVRLDDWVRKGGEAIIFADPALDWPSELPLGDQRRPLFTSLLNPLFRHWGVDLALPVAEKSDAENATVAKYRLMPKSAGIWLAYNQAKVAAKCTIRSDALIAYCAVGKGKALLIADADLLQEAQWTDTLVTNGTIAWLLETLNAMQESGTLPSRLWDNQGN